MKAVSPWSARTSRASDSWLLVLALAQVSGSGGGPATIVRGGMSGVSAPREAVARTREEWVALWRAHSAGQAAPDVDFSNQLIVAVFLGSRPTAGFGVEIVGVPRSA